MRRYFIALLIATAGCGGGSSATQPSSSQPAAPSTSTLTFQVAASALNAADGGSFTGLESTFTARGKGTCVPNPNLAGSFCPDMFATVQGNGRFCQMYLVAGGGRALAPGSYPVAPWGAGATRDSAGITFNCARAGTTCGDSTGSYVIFEIQQDASAVVTRLHMTFEQTCTNNGTPIAGKGTGELWIINGTRGSP